MTRARSALSDAQSEDLACAACGGQTGFAPRTGRLTCHSCGAERDLSFFDRDAVARAERVFDPAKAAAEQPVPATGQIRACTACGGRVVFVGAALSEHCPYCHGPVIALDTEDVYPTTSLIPFAVDKAEATRAAQRWLKTRLARPSDLIDRAAKGDLVGLYVPFWTFDTTEDVKYLVMGSRDGERSAVKLSKSHRGQVQVQLDDVLVPASPHITPMIRDGILHGVQPGLLRAFHPGYLAGFAAERHHQRVSEGLEASTEDRAILIRDTLRAAAGREDLQQVTHQAETTGVRYRRILLPVWILHYRYGEADYRIAVSGIDGQTFGERPYSPAVLYGVSGLISAVIMALGAALGMALGGI